MSPTRKRGPPHRATITATATRPRLMRSSACAQTGASGGVASEDVDTAPSFDQTRHGAASGRDRVGRGAPAVYRFAAQLPSSAVLIERQAVVDSIATHAIVHEASYAGEDAVRVEDWLRAYGAKELAAFGTDHVFALPAPQPPGP